MLTVWYMLLFVCFHGDSWKFTMNTQKLTFILHVDGTSRGMVKPFDSSTWNKVKSVDAVRRQAITETKYFAIAIPGTYIDIGNSQQYLHAK